MSIHVQVTLVAVTLGPKGARVGVRVYRKKPDGTTQDLTVDGQGAWVDQMKIGQTYEVNLPEAGDPR